MAGIDAMRIFVARQYGGDWPERVKRMPDNQVKAIYYTILDEIDSVKKKKIRPKLTDKEVREGIQLSFFENGKSLKIKEGYLYECHCESCPERRAVADAVQTGGEGCGKDQP